MALSAQYDLVRIVRLGSRVGTVVRVVDWCALGHWFEPYEGQYFRYFFVFFCVCLTFKEFVYYWLGSGLELESLNVMPRGGFVGALEMRFSLVFVKRHDRFSSRVCQIETS